MQLSSAINETPERQERSSVLFLLNSLSIGGSERKTIFIANEMRQRGVNVHLAYIDDRAPLAEYVSADVPTYCLFRKSKFSLKSARRLREYVREHAFQYIFCINLHPLLYALMASGLLGRAQRPRLVLFENTTEKVGGKARLSMMLYRPMMRRTEQVVFGCHAQLELWVRQYNLDPVKCTVIYNGIDEQKFSPDFASGRNSEPAARASDRFVIGSVGNFSSNKNHMELVRLLDRLRSEKRHVRLVLVGDGQERQPLERALEIRGLQESVTFAGRVNDVRPHLEDMDVFILPSVSETFSNAALEAMAMGKTVILSNTGGMPEIVEHGVDGFLYERGSIEELAKIVMELEDRAEWRVQIGKRARAKVISRFTFDRMVDEYTQLIR